MDETEIRSRIAELRERAQEIELEIEALARKARESDPAGWQKTVAPPAPGSRPTGLPPRPSEARVEDVGDPTRRPDSSPDFTAPQHFSRAEEAKAKDEAIHAVIEDAAKEWPCQTEAWIDGPDLHDHERLVAFLYRLLRDGARSPGDVENHAIQVKDSRRGEVTYTNAHLRAYAASLASYLLQS